MIATSCVQKYISGHRNDPASFVATAVCPGTVVVALYSEKAHRVTAAAEKTRISTAIATGKTTM
jgi:hypothetical protein